MISDINSNDRLTDEILKKANYLHFTKFSGIDNSTLLSQLLPLVGKLFSRKIRTGKVSEADVFSFEEMIPNADYIGNQKNLSQARKIMEEQNTAALMERDDFNKKSLPIEASKTFSR